MSKKGNLIYRIVTSITLFVPLPLYLFLSATLFNIIPDYTIHAKIDTISVLHIDDEYFITSNDKTVEYSGLVTYNEEYDTWGIYIDSEDIIKIDKKYYSYVLENDVMLLKDIKTLEVQKQTTYKLPLSFFISLFAVLVAVLIIQGKMQWHKQHPRLATLIALLSTTVILFIISTIVSNMLNVFLVATVSWGLYCIEYLVKQSKIDQKQANKTENDIIAQLKNALKG